MVNYQLSYTADFENVAEIRPADGLREVNFGYCLKCKKCGGVTKKDCCVTLDVNFSVYVLKDRDPYADVTQKNSGTVYEPVDLFNWADHDEDGDFPVSVSQLNSRFEVCSLSQEPAPLLFIEHNESMRSPPLKHFHFLTKACRMPLSIYDEREIPTVIGGGYAVEQEFNWANFFFEDVVPGERFPVLPPPSDSGDGLCRFYGVFDTFRTRRRIHEATKPPGTSDYFGSWFGDELSDEHLVSSNLPHATHILEYLKDNGITTDHHYKNVARPIQGLLRWVRTHSP